MTVQAPPQPADILNALSYPVDVSLILRKRESIRKILSEGNDGVECRVAILGGSTTAQVRSALELFLLRHKIWPSFYESEYGRFSEDALYENPDLDSFQPRIVYIHTTSRNLRSALPVTATEAEFESAAASELARFRAIWDRLKQQYPACTIIQNNFDLPLLRPLGNLEAGSYAGQVTLVNRLNYELARAAAADSRLVIQDIQSLSAEIGLEKWSDPEHWFRYKMAVTVYGATVLAGNLANLIQAIFGRTKKCLVLDLDNTLWGGVVGDDGVAGLKLGNETALAEGYLAFQRYVKALKARGVLLAVCSKNEDAAAREGLRHPDGVLREEDFAVIMANWSPKDENVKAIASALNIGLDSLVFVDDNPVERAIVRRSLPDVVVPEVGSDPSRYALILERAGCFETVSISGDDLDRSGYYSANSERDRAQAGFGDYAEFLDSLRMTAEIAPFSPVYLDRIAQLTNKTNQFNLTTRRYTRAEIENIAGDDRFIHLYGRLMDSFGDNGLVSVVMGEVSDRTLKVQLWLMSCRVLKRGMENAMMDSLVEQCLDRGLSRIKGVYLPTAKNRMVANLYGELGFTKTGEDESGATMWNFDIPASYAPANRHIAVHTRMTA